MPTFRFRDKTTGLFYKDAKVDYSSGHLGWADRKRKFEYAQPRKGKKPTKAELGKEFVDMGKAKVHLLYLTGLMRPTESYEKIEQELTECRNRLRNSGAQDIDLFTQQYKTDLSDIYGEKARYFDGINWAKVAEKHNGILITPYIWERRLDMNTNWYYGWDARQVVSGAHPRLWIESFCEKTNSVEILGSFGVGEIV